VYRYFVRESGFSHDQAGMAYLAYLLRWQFDLLILVLYRVIASLVLVFFCGWTRAYPRSRLTRRDILSSVTVTRPMNGPYLGTPTSEAKVWRPPNPRSVLKSASLRGKGGTSRTQMLNTLSHISIGWIFTPDPAISFERVCDPTQRFQGSTEDVEYLNGLLR
jgi:hypothetical protein